MSQPIAVVYLARMAEGEGPLHRFSESYARANAGVDHDLVVLYKGFSDESSLAAAKSFFAPIADINIEIPDVGYDIGSYCTAARELNHDYLCLLNTFTEIVSDNWLANLYTAITTPGVGIAGAMGSYESLYDSLMLIGKVSWLCNVAGIKYDPRVALYYDFIVESQCKYWRAKGENSGILFWDRNVDLQSLPRMLFRWMRRTLRNSRKSIDEQFLEWWGLVTGADGSMRVYSKFPRFPNPHIRSNGFMVSRLDLRRLAPDSIPTKLDACDFESGSNSLTSQLRREGLEALIVGKDGQNYPVPDWFRSRTFRLGKQENLLLTDNRSREFDIMNKETQVTHTRITWGQYVDCPHDFPNLGVHFPTHTHERTGVFD